MDIVQSFVVHLFTFVSAKPNGVGDQSVAATSSSKLATIMAIMGTTMAMNVGTMMGTMMAMIVIKQHLETVF